MSKVFIFLVFNKHHLHRACHVNKFCQLAITGWPHNTQWRKVIKWSSKRITQVEHKIQLLIVSNMDLNPKTNQWKKIWAVEWFKQSLRVPCNWHEGSDCYLLLSASWYQALRFDHQATTPRHRLKLTFTKTWLFHCLQISTILKMYPSL